MASKDGMILIGLGKIGYRGFPQTHYQSAISNGLRVIAGIDSSIDARNRFTSETGIPAYASLTELPKEDWTNFFSLTTSSDASYRILGDLLSKKGPRGILAEKPFCSNAKQSAEILALQASSQTPMRINYLRQYSQTMALIRSEASKSKLVSGIVVYSSGLRENGSHFIRLICGLFPEINSVKDIEWVDASRFRLRVSQDIFIDFMPLDSPHMHNSEIKLIFEEIIISINEGFRVEIRKIDTKSSIRKWARELELVLATDLSDAFESSYRDQSWWRSPDQTSISKELRLDHLCNLLIENSPPPKVFDSKVI